MKGTIRLAVFAAGALILYGCASTSVEDTKFTKRGMSLAAQTGDSDQCWELAQKTNLTDEQAHGSSPRFGDGV